MVFVNASLNHYFSQSSLFNAPVAAYMYDKVKTSPSMAFWGTVKGAFSLYP